MEASGPEEKEKKKTTEKKPKKVIVLMARSHPGEAASSYVLKGFMEELIHAESNVKCQFLRDNFTFLVFPMINPDGVSVGNSRSALCGNDLNETWSQPDRFVHPEVYYAKKILSKLKKDNEIIFAADFHANFEQSGIFLYGSSYQLPAKAAKEQKDFLALLGETVSYFSPSKCRLIAPTEKRESASVVLNRELGVQHSYSIQVSTSQSLDESPFNVENYETFGKQFCHGLSIFLCHKLGQVPSLNEELQGQSRDDGADRLELAQHVQRRPLCRPHGHPRPAKRELRLLHVGHLQRREPRRKVSGRHAEGFSQGPEDEGRCRRGTVEGS